MDGSPLVVGIDIAVTRPCVAVAVKGGRVLEAVAWREADEQVAGDRGRLLDWLQEQAPAAVAVDAPQRPKRTASGSAKGRRCDAELLRRRIAVYQVPTRAEAEAADGRLYGWMATGWRYFSELGRRGYEPPPPGAMPGLLGQAPAALEVYPHAAFVTLLGGTPPPKTTREGLRVRVLTLEQAGVRWSGYYDHDSLDALAAALTAWRFLQGRATPLGDGRDGYIWLPVPEGELAASYARLDARDAVAAVTRLKR